jgi:hypothetical protein
VSPRTWLAFIHHFIGVCVGAVVVAADPRNRFTRPGTKTLTGPSQDWGRLSSYLVGWVTGFKRGNRPPDGMRCG